MERDIASLSARRILLHTLPMRMRVTLFLSCCAAVTHAAPIVSTGGGDGVTTDVFDINQSSEVLGSSPLLGCCGGSFAENSFGGFGGVEPPHTLFSDGPAVGSSAFIRFAHRRSDRVDRLQRGAGG